MRNEAVRRTRNNTARGNNYYVDGNTVRRMEAVPDYRRQREERERREREAEQKRKRRIARRNQEQALRVSRSYVAFLTMAALIFAVFAGLYVCIQSDITARMNTISRLESQIADVRAENDEAYKRINTSVDLENIRNVAMEQLGMSYAKESQIVYYSVEDDDYMNQYGEIPTE